MAIASEQGRVYRATINGLISTADGARLTYQLKELRCTREALALEAENAAKKIAGNSGQDRGFDHSRSVRLLCLPGTR